VDTQDQGVAPKRFHYGRQDGSVTVDHKPFFDIIFLEEGMFARLRRCVKETEPCDFWLPLRLLCDGLPPDACGFWLPLRSMVDAQDQGLTQERLHHGGESRCPWINDSIHRDTVAAKTNKFRV
jgi:hypothetical protein